jgi:hypothetical protein
VDTSARNAEQSGANFVLPPAILLAPEKTFQGIVESSVPETTTKGASVMTSTIHGEPRGALRLTRLFGILKPKMATDRPYARIEGAQFLC